MARITILFTYSLDIDTDTTGEAIEQAITRWNNAPPGAEEITIDIVNIED